MSQLTSARWPRYASAAVLFLLTGCTSYHSAPLPTAPDLTSSPALTVPAAEFQLPGLQPHPIATGGLDRTTVMLLAVFDNPDLKAARLQSGVASAQVLQAGLLPDPQLTAGFATSALNYGYEAGLSEDLRALLTRGAVKQAAAANQQQVHLGILWQETQIAERASELFFQIAADTQLQQTLEASQKVLADQYARDQRALDKADVTIATTSADLAVLTDAETGLRQLQLDENTARHQLNQLVGLKPDVELRLAASEESAPLTREQLQTAVSELPHRRADLLALQAGYQSQEQAVRQAILAQYPGLSVGVAQSRDPVEGVNDFGPSVSLTLPLFNRNRGQIALQRATREVLRQTYQARLDQSAGDADQVWRSTVLMEAQLRDLNAQIPVLRTTATAAETSFHEGNMSAADYTSLETALLAKEAEAIRLHASLEAAQSALRTVLGLPLSAP